MITDDHDDIEAELYMLYLIFFIHQNSMLAARVLNIFN